MAQSGSHEFAASGKPAFVVGTAVAVGLLQFAQGQSVYADCMLASGEVPVEHQSTAVVQPVTETSLPPIAAAPPPPPSPEEVREAQAEQAAEAWALAQRVLYHPDVPGRAESLYRSLCAAGDPFACMMSAALDPRLGALKP